MEKQWPDVWRDTDGAEWHLDALVWDGGYVRETWKRWHLEERLLLPLVGRRGSSAGAVVARWRAAARFKL